MSDHVIVGTWTIFGQFSLSTVSKMKFFKFNWLGKNEFHDFSVLVIFELVYCLQLFIK